MKALVKYVRGSKNSRVGVVVAIGRGQVGWSRCNNRLDTFDKQRGLVIAMGRAGAYCNVAMTALETIPSSMRDAVMDMHNRSQRYYKEGAQS